MNPQRWLVAFACGHESWVTQASRPAVGAHKDCDQCPRGHSTSVAGMNYVLHLRDGDRTLCGRLAASVNCGDGTESDEALCRPCKRARNARAGAPNQSEEKPHD